jgi:hypothetical protein
MDLFPRSLRRRLSRAIESGEFKRQDTLDQAGGKLTEVFQCDSLDLIEVIVGIEEGKHRKPRTIGDLIDLREDEKSGDVPSRAPRK